MRPARTLGKLACCLTNGPRLELSGQEWVFIVVALSVTKRGLAARSGKTHDPGFCFCPRRHSRSCTAKIVAVIRNGGVWRDGTRIAVLVGAHIYDLNGNLLGNLAASDGSLPISFKNLFDGKSAHAERALVA